MLLFATESSRFNVKKENFTSYRSSPSSSSELDGWMEACTFASSLWLITDSLSLDCGPNEIPTDPGNRTSAAMTSTEQELKHTTLAVCTRLGTTK